MRTMQFFNPSANFSNDSSRQGNEACDIFDKTYPEKIGQITAFLIILLSSFVGNTLIIITVCKREELRNTINYFIVNLAGSDIMLPLTVSPVFLTETAPNSRRWYISGNAGLIFCKLEVFLQHISVTVSVQSLLWIAFDRFVAVVLPMKAHLISSRFRAFAIASTWIVAIVINSSDFYTHGLVEIDEKTICERLNNTSSSFKSYESVRIFILHIVPLATLTILYCAIAVTLRRQDKAVRCAAMHQRNGRKRQAIKMSLCIMAAFYICVFPITLLHIMPEDGIQMPCMVYKTFWFCAIFMFQLSSTVNPIICFSFVQSYRCGLKEICNWCWNERSTASSVEMAEQDGITLNRIRAIPESREISEIIEQKNTRSRME